MAPWVTTVIAHDSRMASIRRGVAHFANASFIFDVCLVIKSSPPLRGESIEKFSIQCRRCVSGYFLFLISDPGVSSFVLECPNCLAPCCRDSGII